MEKVKLTQEQAEAIERYKRELVDSIDEQYRFGVKRTPHEWAEPLVELGGKQVLEIIKHGYEVEEKFEIGDWVVHENRKLIGEVIRIYEDVLKITRLGDSHIWNKKYTRHATPEEIAEEKQRRWWAKHGRGVFEFKTGDLINHAGMILEVEKPEDDLVCIKINESRGTLTERLYHQIKVICFAEDRKDLEA